ncbi:hypothetical protein SAMN05444422_11558 [Halobiforma haloterrestris]|uniref:Rad51 protein n=2 Tax=Natronobacterium haloterrestre TaxID=148448 RepID=A0A1I1LAG9_NATHA|nr:hypothetical protein SAMN05444422_11558 [Halobiforma haloterrestris]
MAAYSQSESNRMTVDGPTRDADRNRNLVDRADPATDGMLFPRLSNGITLLDVAGGRGVQLLQSFVLDHLLLNEGPAFWIDADGHATTTSIARIAPSRRLLDRIHVARGFTAYQHYGAVRDLPTAVNRSIQRSATDADPRDRSPSNRSETSSPHTPSLVVVPAVDVQYRASDSLTGERAETLQARTLARLGSYADGYDVPVLVTRSKRDEFSRPVETAADRRIECERTKLGPRFVGEDFETIVYPVDDGAYYQTTFAYWRRVLELRARQVGLEPTTEPSTGGPDAVGVGSGTGTDSTAHSATPLLETWTAADTGGR